MPAPAKLYEFKVGDTRPSIDGIIQGVNLTGGTVACLIENTADGSSPFVDTTATIVSATASRTRVRYTPPAPWVGGVYLGWFVGTLGAAVHRSPGFTVRVVSADRTPVVGGHSVIYGDGRGGYATVADVMVLMRNRDGFSDKTDEALVEVMLGDTATELDRVLERYYRVPVTKAASPKAFDYLRTIHKYWALAAIYDLLIPIAPDQMASAAIVYREKGTQMFDDLVEGNVILADAVATRELAASPVGTGARILGLLDADDPLGGSGPVFRVDGVSRNGRLPY